MNTELRQEGFIGIHQSFAETELGQTLAGRVRYEKYKPTDVTNERWEQLLGADVNNLDHLRLTYGLTQSMIRNLEWFQPGFLDQREADVLLVTALIHDWAEAVVGDINYNDKTDEDEAEEMRQLSAILDDHYGSSGGDLKDIVLEAASVVPDRDSKLGLVFNTIERVGYMRTALRAAKHVIEATAPDCENELRWMMTDVFGNHVGELVKRSVTYLPVESYLLRQAEAIDEGFDLVTPDIFTDNYSVATRETVESNFHLGYQAWNGWIGERRHS